MVSSSLPPSIVVPPPVKAEASMLSPASVPPRLARWMRVMVSEAGLAAAWVVRLAVSVPLIAAAVSAGPAVPAKALP